jgi:hypothetical protein
VSGFDRLARLEYDFAMHLRALALTIFMSLAPACAHYGWTSPNTTATNDGLGVSTIGVRGDSGLDPAALTRTMVERLRLRGLPAEWGTAPTTAECEVVIVNDGAVERTWSPTAQILCSIGPRQYQAVGHATASMDIESNETIRTIQQAAAANAVEAVADMIADAHPTGENDGKK